MEEHETASSKIRRWFSPKASLFELDPRYFPETTRSLIPIEVILREGVLPLGFKAPASIFRAAKKLNVGFVEPSSARSLDMIKDLVRGKLESQDGAELQRFELDPVQFVKILETVYSVPAAKIAAMDTVAVHPAVKRAALEKSSDDGAPPA